MIRRFAALMLLTGLLALSPAVPAARAQDEGRPDRPQTEEKRRARKPANVSFLFSAFLFTWIGIWAHLVIVHRGQNRLDKTLARMEKETARS